MSKCSRIKSKADKICIGDLNKLIKLEVNRKVSPASGNSYATVTTTEDLEVWAKQTSSKGVVSFGESNLEQVVTDYFYIRYLPDINITSSIVYDDKRYSIVDIENLNGNNEFLKISTNKRGDSTLKANYL